MIKRFGFLFIFFLFCFAFFFFVIIVNVVVVFCTLTFLGSFTINDVNTTSDMNPGPNRNKTGNVRVKDWQSSGSTKKKHLESTDQKLLNG